MSTEMRGLFHSRAISGPSQQSPVPSTSTAPPDANCVDHSHSLLSRAERLCKQIRPGKSIHNRRKSFKPYKRAVGKEVQKNLVVIDFQGDNPSEVVPLREYEKLYDGCMRYRSDMSETEIREEIVRLVRQKESDTHTLDCLMPEDFNFVRCANRRVRIIDGDTPFDGSGIAQVYKNGAIYVRLNTQALEPYSVSVGNYTLRFVRGE